MIRTMIVDDEPHALHELQSKMVDDNNFEVVATCGNAFEAIRDINKFHPDVVFLDINMPKISGIEMLSMLDRDSMPHIVFVTAHGEYAIEAFKENAIDFLLKPVSDERLRITLERLKEDHRPQAVVTQAFPTDLKFIPCYRANQYYLVNISEVVHLYSTPTTGVQLVTANDELAFHTTLSLKVFDGNSPLIRCHRQHMVNPAYIKLIEKLEHGLGQIHTTGDHIIPVSRNYMDKLPSFS